MLYLKNNKYILLILFTMIIMALLSFYNVHNDRFGYVDGYYKIKEKCTGENDTDEICRIVPTKELLKTYLESSNPEKIKKDLDPIFLTSEVIFENIFFSLQILGPLLIIFATTFTIQPYLNSMVFRDYYMREGEKNFKLRLYKKVFLISLIIPFSLLFIHIISLIYLNFDYSYVNEYVKNISFYFKEKYDYYFIYGACVLLIQFLMSIFYSNIAIIFMYKNKKTLSSFVYSSIFMLFLVVFLYVFIRDYLLFNVLQLNFPGHYLGIISYFYFDSVKGVLVALIISFTLSITSFFIVKKVYKHKERLIFNYEGEKD